jgi:hypothetical protein
MGRSYTIAELENYFAKLATQQGLIAQAQQAQQAQVALSQSQIDLQAAILAARRPIWSRAM